MPEPAALTDKHNGNESKEGRSDNYFYALESASSTSCRRKAQVARRMATWEASGGKESSLDSTGRQIRILYRRPAESRWNFEAISKIAANPWSTRDKPEVAMQFQDASEQKEVTVRNLCPIPKAFRINYADLMAHGFAKDCPQCDHNILHQKSKTGHVHTTACRR